MRAEYFECTICGDVVQGWHAAHEWYQGPCLEGSVHDWEECPGPFEDDDDEGDRDDTK